ncbi:hypothetical protein GALMADRAFT_145367 [Galerina marginata CBS 339.88]|uniref:Anaphase-promoting complex subunit 5 domain-containing protein n=1 Tax=Galerina marginata (strain CBS 339.88) TaxID=685588 RepID=A0A067SPL5_GALM3|nr:hypothetical protein GALMADRAFT_145367 [Galerina marginata CBS 339.88]
MDPFSIALATVTLTTAVKDLAELVQKLERSVSKPAENIRNAEMLATEVRRTLDQLKQFCDEQEGILSNADDMKVALSDLIRDMESVYNKCSGIAPVTAMKKIDKFKATFGAWKNRNKVQSEIKELMNRVNRCYTQFMMFSIMRIEKRQVISTDTRAQTSNIIRNEISTTVSDERIIGFIGSNSATLSKLPPEIQMSSDLISDAYLRLQINTINALMEKLSSTASYPVEEPTGGYLLPFQTFPTFLVVASDRFILRNDVIMQALQIQTILQGDSASLSVQVGAGALRILAVHLLELDMYHESVLISTWAIKLFRTLVTSQPTTYLPYLSLSLSNLALAQARIDDDVNGALSSISESIDIGRSLQTPFASLDIKLLLPYALRISASMTSCERNSFKSLQEAEEAVHFFDNVIASSNLTNDALQTGKKLPEILDNSSSSAAHCHAQALHQLSPSSAVYHYAQSLQRFSTSLRKVGRFAQAFQTQQRALEILDFLVPFYPDHLDLERARALYQVLEDYLFGFRPPTDALPMSQELISIFGKYFEMDRQKYGTELCNALWQNAVLLERMGQYDNALLVWKEVTYLVQEANTDRLRFARALEKVSDTLRLLDRYDEAAISRRKLVDIYQTIHKAPSRLEAYAHYDIAYDLTLAGQFPEAIRRAQTCIIQCRTLAFQDPGQYKKYLAKGLCLLSSILFNANEYKQAFDESNEAFDLYQSIIQDTPFVYPKYVACIRLQMQISQFLDNETMSIERGQHLIHHSNELVKIFPNERDQTLIYATWIHSRNLERFDRLTEATVTIRGALEWYESVPADTPSTMEMHMQCLQQMAIVLEAQGYPERALGAFEEATNIGKKLSSHPDIVDLLPWTIANRAVSLFEVGRYSEALTASQDAVSVIRGTESANTFTLVWCLQVAFIVQQFTKTTEAAINGLQEAINLCRAGITAAKDLPAKLTRLVSLSGCLISMSQARADIGNEVEAMCLAQEGLDEIMKVKSTNPILPWRDVRSMHMDTLHNLSLRLASNNNLSRALDLITEAGTYYEQRAQARNGLYPQFAWILLSQGVLYCAAGRHEEGIEARSKLTDIQERLGVAFPKLARCVQLKLDREMERPSWLALVAKLDLHCNHQDVLPK